MSPLTGKITSINFNTTIPTSYRKATVLGPHWTEALASHLWDGIGSRRPAIFQKGAAASANVEISLSGTDNSGAIASLSATIGGITLNGTAHLVDGLQVVPVFLQGVGTIGRHAGSAAWTISSPNGPFRLDNPTALEIYTIHGSPPTFFAPGIWTEALRFDFLNVGITTGDNESQTATKIVQFCHSKHTLKYDTGAGRPSYGVDDRGGSFNLTQFLKASKPQVNCFDLVAAVQVLGGALGVSTNWLTIQPFGFIHLTSLVGVGACNNPFFSLNSSPAVVSDRKDSRRKDFGMHGFCELAAVIFDACVGPHLGTDARPNYLSRAVDPINFRGSGVPNSNLVHNLHIAVQQVV